MKTVDLPGTTLATSRLGYGLSGIHHLLRSPVRQNVLSAALDSGIRHFDVSPLYGHGIAERELGEFAKGRRDKLLVVTKFGIEPDPWMGRFPLLMYARMAGDSVLRRLSGKRHLYREPPRDYSGANAVASLHRSLRAMRTDYVDIFYLHEPDLSQLTDTGPLFDTLNGLRDAGKIRYFGLTGDAQDCIAIRRRHPDSNCLLQVNAAPGPGELDLLNSASIPFHGSFGHFRERTKTVADCLASAIGANRRGVILFSSRRADHVRSMVQTLTALEAA